MTKQAIPFACMVENIMSVLYGSLLAAGSDDSSDLDPVKWNPYLRGIASMISLPLFQKALGLDFWLLGSGPSLQSL